VSGEQTEPLPRVEAMIRLQKATKVEEAVEVIRAAQLPREAVPTEWLTKPEIWESLLEQMPMTAMIRNLATMTKVGLLAPGSVATKKVVSELQNVSRLRKARVHPMALLLAERTYAKGKGLKGSGTWDPVPAIIDALDEAFYTAFENVEPTGQRYLLGIDVSGSMSWQGWNTPLMASEVAAAMAMVTIASEDAVTPMAFETQFRPLPLSRRMRLDQVMQATSGLSFGGTDCAVPMIYAREKKIPVDVFVVYTDNETWAGKIHPAQALEQYRQAMGIAAKLIVVAVTASSYSIADPNDAGMLDVVGFDASVPSVMREFVVG
jgi:60 kDa SS-A/Ro ribonucleoprotein